MASQYPLREEEVDDVLEDEEATAQDDVDEAELSFSPRRDRPEDFSVTARQRLREELSRQIEAYLAGGGHIHEIPSRFNDARPKKPVSDYSDRLM